MQSQKLFIGTGTYNNDNTPFFASGSGHFSLGSTFAWNATDKSLNVSGSSVTFNTGKFFFGSNSQFVSGSNNNIEISSSMFHLDPKKIGGVLAGEAV